MAELTKSDILRIADEKNIKFLRLQFSDILGNLKSFEIPRSNFEFALEKASFDGSTIEGFVGVEQSDMFLRPDYNSFAVFPWYSPLGEGKVARVLCDVYDSDEMAFVGDPRYILKRALRRAENAGYAVKVSLESEFFLFDDKGNGVPSIETEDTGGYFDMGPVDKGEECRREICSILEEMGIKVAASHHGLAPAQHQITLVADEALRMADNFITLKYVVKSMAQQHGLLASFMPKPIFGINGSGLHINMALFRGTKNVFSDETDKEGLSQSAYRFIAGIMENARDMTLVLNPLVNSFRRLVPGFEAPVHVAWSGQNRSALVRIPAARGAETKVELRSPDGACNPYLAFAVCLLAGLDGIEKGLTPPPATNVNVFKMGRRQSDRVDIETLPTTMDAAIELYENSRFLKQCFGEHVYNQYMYSKKRELNSYRSGVSSWEIENYLLKC